MSAWRERARQRIAYLTADLPAEASLAERRKALWGKGSAAHQGTCWGRRMWGEEVRAYLVRHGAAPGSPKGTFEFPDHVHFPFRDRADG